MPYGRPAACVAVTIPAGGGSAIVDRGVLGHGSSGRDRRWTDAEDPSDRKEAHPGHWRPATSRHADPCTTRVVVFPGLALDVDRASPRAPAVQLRHPDLGDRCWLGPRRRSGSPDQSAGRALAARRWWRRALLPHPPAPIATDSGLALGAHPRGPHRDPRRRPHQPVPVHVRGPHTGLHHGPEALTPRSMRLTGG